MSVCPSILVLFRVIRSHSDTYTCAPYFALIRFTVLAQAVRSSIDPILVRLFVLEKRSKKERKKNKKKQKKKTKKKQ
ncbi:hypothetical protein BO99DRAFT_223137 [Aspergillus violaceofuscus CBS 115571]|uniref:Uncharacterized protein n=1 Tax=Aspergillus violaceofuscus (strain CBS 115571) TaxID=1450538 RepID=A0A2V5HH15_ASPV1|nr:hypothetical protein BO99DRAFT_223137 [Aspergillus violaceofuscus CBS 115571]